MTEVRDVVDTKIFLSYFTFEMDWKLKSIHGCMCFGLKNESLHGMTTTQKSIVENTVFYN